MPSIYRTCLLLANLGLAWSLSINSPRDSRNRAAYFLINDPAGDSIVALKISKDNGTLSDPIRTPTGGKGLANLVAVSQDSVVVSEDYLFTVNPGSNTVSMFVIDPEDPWHPKLVGSPAATMGETPVAVAYSRKLKTACVVNSGAVAGVICYSVDHAKGLTAIGPLRPIPQPTDNGTPPPGPVVLGSDIVFNPSSTGLFVGVRSNGAVPGYISAWPVEGNQVSTQAVISTISDIAIEFTINFLGSDSRMLITIPVVGASGAAYLDVSPSLQITEEKQIVIPGQVAACWAVFSPRFNSAYVVDAAQPNITVIDPQTGDLKGTIHFEVTTAGSGGIDMAADREWLYSLTDDPVAPKINVFSLEGGNSGKLPQQVQSYDLFSSVGSFPFWMGMSIYPS